MSSQSNNNPGMVPFCAHIVCTFAKCELMLFLCLSVCHQYSEKEDKYEEEIKVLTDKLKEVR